MLQGCLEEESLSCLLKLVKARVFRHGDATSVTTAVQGTEPGVEEQGVLSLPCNQTSPYLLNPAELERALADAEIKVKAVAADLGALRIWQTMATSVVADPLASAEIEQRDKAAQLYDSFEPQSRRVKRRDLDGSATMNVSDDDDS